jgi:hypothetical protein
MSRKGVSNVILMVGIIIAMSVILVSGFFLIQNFLQAQVNANSQYLSTELVSILNTVQSGPEEVQFNYYTATDENGYPVIGSLEIDDDRNELCVHPKTEDEIFGTIADKAAIAGGFGAVGYANARIRGAVAQRATQTAVRDEVFFSNRYVVPFGPDIAGVQPDVNLLPDTSTVEGRQLAYHLGKQGDEANALRKYWGGGRLNKKEAELFAKWTKNPDNKGAWGELRKKRAAMVDGLRKGNPRAQELSKAAGAGQGMSKIQKLKHPFRYRELSKSHTKLLGFLQRHGGDVKIVTRLKDKLTAFKLTPLRSLGSGAAKNAGRGIMVGIVAAQYILSGGDWEQTSATAIQLVTANYAPKVIAKILISQVPKVSAQLATQLGINSALATSEEAEGGIPVYGQAAFGVKKIAEIIVNIAFSAYYLAELDLTLFKIFDASADAVKAERELKACRTFNNYNSGKVLLSPPNCVPEVKFGPSIEQWQGLYAGGFGLAAGSFTTSLGIATATAFVPVTGGVRLAGLVTFGIGAASLITTSSAFAINLGQNSADIAPKSVCEQSCDRDYKRQDCPNWFVSDIGLGTTAAGSSFVGLLQGGPVCAGLSAIGWAGMACNGARIAAATTAFVAFPAEVINFMLNTHQVGFNKPAIRSKSALGLENEFSDNDGYWYAELPFTIEMNKVYASGDTVEERNPSLVITKA